MIYDVKPRGLQEVLLVQYMCMGIFMAMVTKDRLIELKADDRSDESICSAR